MIEKFGLKNTIYKQNNQKSAIVILIILNLFQLRELGLIRITLKDITHQLLLVDLEMEHHRDFQK